VKVTHDSPDIFNVIPVLQPTNILSSQLLILVSIKFLLARLAEGFYCNDRISRRMGNSTEHAHYLYNFIVSFKIFVYLNKRMYARNNLACK